MSDARPISVNGVTVDPSPWPSPQLAAVHELLRQRAVNLGLLSEAAPDDEVSQSIERLIDQEVQAPAPSEEECRRFYDAHPDLFRSGDLVFVRHILFQVTPGVSLPLVRSKAEEALRHVSLNPQEFEACAKALSNCPSGQHGGNLGQIGRGDTVPEFEAALFADGWIGILPRLVKTRFGFHVVAIDRRVEGRLLPLEAARAQIAARLAAQVQEVALKQYVRLLAGRAEIEGVELDAAITPLIQ